jgi:hypothetical protein
MPIVYLIQPAELIGTDRYKIGRSAKNDLSRFKAYKSGTRFIMILECDDDVKLEKYLIDEFKKLYRKVAGNEYFGGNEQNMKDTFSNLIKIFNSIEFNSQDANGNDVDMTQDFNDIYYDDDVDMTQDFDNEEYKFKCIKCGKDFANKKYLNQHYKRKTPCDKKLK